MAKKEKKNPPERNVEEVEILNAEQEKIVSWLKKVKFKKQFFNGVSELDVWKKIEELNNMYNVALAAERARYDALLEQARAGTDTKSKDGGGA